LKPGGVEMGTWGERVREAIEKQGSILCVGLDPVWERLPAEYRSGSVTEGIFAYNRRIIDGAAPYAAAFKPQYKCYSAEGEEGLRALKMTCEYIREKHPHIPVILDAKYADVGHVVERCAHEAFELYGVDAVTAMPAPGREALWPLLSRRGRGCFVVARTSNPGAGELQDIPVEGGEPLYVRIAKRVGEMWNEMGSAGLVGPATEPPVLARIREAAPGLPILCPGVGAQGGDVEAAVRAGVGARGAGLLINVSRAIMEAPDPGEAAREWRDRMNAARTMGPEPAKDGQWTVDGREELQATSTQPAASSQQLRELREAIIEMYRIGAIEFRPVTLKSGLVSPYYNNLRLLASYPALLKQVAGLMAQTVKGAGVEPEIWVGIAMAGIPLAVAISQHTGIGAGYVRAEAKGYGTKRMVEGAWHEGARAILVDDVVSDGASKLEVLEHVRAAGLEVDDIVVLVDRSQGGPDLMARHGLRCHATITMEQVLDILLSEGLITGEQAVESRRFMGEARRLVADSG
jgi:uridine monophosphate synthetase